MTWAEELADQLDSYWREHLWPRVAGLTDEEYLWQPVPGMWTLRPDAEGVVRADFRFPEPPIPPATTIAWRLDHVAREVLGKRAAAFFGGSPADAVADADMFDDRHWPQPRPLDAAGALAQLQQAYALWHAGVSGLTDETMQRPLGPRGAAYADDSVARLVLHINREVMAHGAEICLLRDLYRAEADARDPLVAAALRGDAEAVRALNGASARPSLAAEAAGLGHWQVVRALIDAGAPVEGALHYAAGAGDADLADVLVGAGARLDALDPVFGLTPAGWARYRGHDELAARLGGDVPPSS